MSATIIQTGRGPVIEGSRITVFDVLAETEAGATPAELAEWYNLTVADIQAALRYIEENKEDVWRDWRKIKERHARGNPPEIQAKLDATHAKYAPIWAEKKRLDEAQARGEVVDFGPLVAKFHQLRLAKENGDAGNPGGH